MVNDTTESKELERYSFSKLSSFYTCKLGYQLSYIEHLKGQSNSFALYGTFVHELMEKYAKGEIDLYDLPDVYEEKFEKEVNIPFPDSPFCDLKSLYYKQGLNFLQKFLGYENYEILGIEKEFTIQIDDWLFNGFIDLILRDKKTNELIILDYKSKAKFKNKLEKQKYARQLYLYSIYIKQEFGQFPDRLVFLMFRKQNIENIAFDSLEFHEALTWARYAVSAIRKEKEYLPTYDEFFCNNLCNHRQYCKHKNCSRKK